MMIAENPILSGFYPDPSICRVGDTFYLVNSTFAYFPGVPVFASRDLAQWEQIGNVLDRPSQIPLEECGHSAGIYAPTIRYHDGTFYMITTNVSGGGNFIVTAEKPEGPWSEPYYLGEAAKGIDPSLFFEEDGSCYYIGQRENSAGGTYFGDCEIWIQRLDLQTMQLTGEAKAVLHGFQKQAVWPEGPHLYKKDGYYYILHAESGTEFNHCIVIARSRDLWGPYEYCPSNPILTHRHLGRQYPVTCVGHGDLVEDGCGNWYMVMLACRPEEGYTLMGRETFLAKVIWEEGWPVVNPGIGRLTDTVELPGGLQKPGEMPARSRACVSGEAQMGGKQADEAQVYRFVQCALPKEFLMLRNTPKEVYSLEERQGYLRLYMKEDTLKDQGTPAYAALRQRHRAYEVKTAFEVHFTGKQGECAGLAIMQSNENHLRMEYFCGQDGPAVRLISCENGNDTLLAQRTLNEEEMTDAAQPQTLRMKAAVNGLKAAFYYAGAKMSGAKNESSADKTDWQLLAEQVDLRGLSTERAGGFVGCTVGMYASANGSRCAGYADFAEFAYKRV